MFESDRHPIVDFETVSLDNLNTETKNPGNHNAEHQDTPPPHVPVCVKKGLGESHTLMNLIKSNIGTGLLAMPVILKYCGLWAGFFIILAAGAIAIYSMHILVRTSTSVRKKNNLEHHKMDYTETVFAVFKYGPERLRKPKGKIKHTINAFLILSQIGILCVYVLFITENIRYFSAAFLPGWSLNFYAVSFLVALALIPLCLFDDMHILTHLSVLANIATLIGLVLIFAYLFSIGLHESATLSSTTDWKSLLIGFNIAVFSFEGISLILPIENKMAHPETYTYTCGVLNVGMLIVVCANAALGFYGFLVFGEKTEGSITLSIPEYPYWFAPIKPLFIFSIFLSYSLQYYVPAAIFTRLMDKLKCHRNASDQKRYIHEKIMRVALIFVTYLMVILVPRLDLMISLVGSFASSVLAFTMPSLLELVHLWPNRRNIRRFWLTVVFQHCLIITFGLFIFVGGTAATLIQLIQAFSPSIAPTNGAT